MSAVGGEIVILGRSGFIGAALQEGLQGEAGFDVKGYGSSSFDLTLPDSPDRLSEVLDEQTTLIVAARSRRDRDESEVFSRDVAIATHIARCLFRRKVKRCLYLSSVAVYGEGKTNLDITEGTNIGPTSFYGAAKFTGENLVARAAGETGVPLIVLRPCRIYGPGDTSGSYGPASFLESILRERKVRVFGDGSELRDYVFVKDLVRIVRGFILSDHCGTYNVATGGSYSHQDVVALLRKVVPWDFEAIHLERNRPKVDLRINISKLTSALRGLSFTDLERGLSETFAHLTSEVRTGGSKWAKST